MTSDACGGPAAGLRRGWCPTATVPMAAADGLLLRVRPPSGCLDAGALRRLARICREHGNGAVVLTRRAKLELRGIADGDAAVSALRAAGLVPADGRDELLPDCIESPATDLDATAVGDVGAVSREFRESLRAWGRGAELPAKFALVLDGGGLAHVGGVRGDLRFDAIAQSTWRVSLAGTQVTALSLGRCAGEDVPAVAVALLERFLDLRSGHEDDVRRIGHALARWGHEDFLAAANDWLTPEDVAPPERPEGAVVGYRPGAWYGVAFAFGRLDADTLRHLADACERHGDGTLRILPGRAVLLARASAEVGAVLRTVGAIDRADDPRLRVETCSGLGGCDRATTPTRDDARALVASAPALLAAGTGCLLHVSGCAKSCAHSGPAPVTLTGREGRYDLSFCAAAGEAPSWQGLDRAAAAVRLAALERIFLRCRLDGEPVAATLARLGTARLRDLIEEEVRVVEQGEQFEYIRDGQAIYRQSFAIIEAEADLDSLPADLRDVAVRMTHACGMTDIAGCLRFSERVGADARAALRAGAPILCDSEMVAHGITRKRLPAGNAVICTLRDPETPRIAERIGNTRSAAALELWGEQLDGAVVAIGNAPTALFRLLELVAAGAPRPAAVLGLPVGFVGAVESKEALAEQALGLEYLTITGRRGGSAMAASAVNALASDRL